jgi:hypothetical protein
MLCGAKTQGGEGRAGFALLACWTPKALGAAAILIFKNPAPGPLGCLEVLFSLRFSRLGG